MTARSSPPKAIRTRANPRFLIIGAGMSGILSAIKLKEAGLDDFVIYEKADRLGGTWRENTYPGIACDVPSHLYSYSFALNPEWSHRFAPGAEIQAYFEDVARRYGVDSRIRFGKEVTRCAFEDGRWKIEMADGSTDDGDFVIAATGVLHHPAYPDISRARLLRRRGLPQRALGSRRAARRQAVGVVGTGSSAIQIVSALVDEVAELTLFQRTPQWVTPVENTPYSEEEKAEFRRRPEAMQEIRAEVSRALHRRLRQRAGRLQSRPFSRRSTTPARPISRTTSRTRSCARGSARLPRRLQATDHVGGISTTRSSGPTRSS